MRPSMDAVKSLKIREAPPAWTPLERVGFFRILRTFKLPERLELVKEFPMTQVEKINKKELRAIIQEKLQKESNGR